MRVLFNASILVLLISPVCFAEEPVPILKAQWKRATFRPQQKEVTPVGPVTPVMAETKYFQRKAREARTDNPMDPNTESMEGRSRADGQGGEGIPHSASRRGYGLHVHR